MCPQSTACRSGFRRLGESHCSSFIKFKPPQDPCKWFLVASPQDQLPTPIFPLSRDCRTIALSQDCQTIPLSRDCRTIPLSWDCRTIFYRTLSAKTQFNPYMDSLTYRQLETLFKGVANHRRIQILQLLQNEPSLSLWRIRERVPMGRQTVCEHVRRLASAKLVQKKYKGREVEHTLAPLGQRVLYLLPGLLTP